MMKCMAKLKVKIAHREGSNCASFEPDLLFNALIADNGQIFLMTNGSYSIPVSAQDVDLIQGGPQ